MENFADIRRKPALRSLCLLQDAFPMTQKRPGNLPERPYYSSCYWAAVIIFTTSAIAPASDIVQLVAKITIKLSCFLQ